MKGYFSIEIPTKKYIKAYIHHKLGERPIINKRTGIGNKFYDLIRRQTNEDVSGVVKPQYNASMELYVTHSTFYHRGGYLSETDIKNFNLFVEDEIKRSYRMLMDILIELRPEFEANLPEVRKRIGIDLEAWDTESIKKDYYRYRKRNGRSLLYSKDENCINVVKKTI